MTPMFWKRSRDTTYNAYITVRDLIEGEEVAKGQPKSR